MVKDPAIIWNECLKIIKDIVEWQHYNTWFAPIKPRDLRDNLLVIEVPSQFFHEYLEEHYLELISKTLRRVLGKSAKLEYRIMVDSGSHKNQPITMDIPTGGHRNVSGNVMEIPMMTDIRNPFTIPGIRKTNVNSQLNPAYTFETHIEGECNRTARQAGMAVADKPGATSFNPFFVYGGVGLGKTHLVQAVGNLTRIKHPGKSILYVSSEKFINQFGDHSRSNAINDFINFYQMIDVLILDDIQFFNRAEKSQDVLFAIFNHLHQSGKQLIFTSDKPPRDLAGLQDRLLSRFKWGLSAEMQIPDFETRMEIVITKMKKDGIKLPEDVIKFIAYNISSNIRELEGALISLLAQSSLNKVDINLELAKRVLRNFVKNSCMKELTIETIQNLVCEYYSVPFEKLMNKTRKREIVQARQITMYLAKAFTKHSLKTIGEHFGGRDHTTVIHSCQTVKDLMDTDSTFRESVLELQQKVQLATL